MQAQKFNLAAVSVVGNASQQEEQVVGVHIMVEGAGELMGEAALLVKLGIPIEAVAAAIHLHPILTESFVMAVRKVMAQANSQTAK